MHALKDFLGGRINEDESTAQRAIDGHEAGFDWASDTTADGRQAARWNPWRVLNSCVGKRLILAAHHDVGPGTDCRDGEDDVVVAHTCASCGQVDQHAIAWPCYTVRIMALDWVEHVDYRTEWRPLQRHRQAG